MSTTTGWPPGLLQDDCKSYPSGSQAALMRVMWCARCAEKFDWRKR